MPYTLKIILIAFVYFLPWIVARSRRLKVSDGIGLLNLFGFLGVTWLGALIWAVSAQDKRAVRG